MDGGSGIKSIEFAVNLTMQIYEYLEVQKAVGPSLSHASWIFVFEKSSGVNISSIFAERRYQLLPLQLQLFKFSN